MKIYFAGSIRAGRNDRDLYLALIEHLSKYGQVLTEHVGDENLTAAGEERPEEEIFARDVEWLLEADIVVAEVSTPSLGVGYELGLAESRGKRVLCLYRSRDERRLSAMVKGNPAFEVHQYSELRESSLLIDRALSPAIP